MTEVAAIILKVSGMLAVYGLVIMYKATHDLLHDWKTTRKFVSVKIVILLSVVQNKIFSWFIHTFRPMEKSCLLTPGNPKDLERIVVFWTTFATLMETMLLSHLIIRAFPAEEVSDYPLKNLDLVELELRQIHERIDNAGLESSSSEDDEK
eukprot:Skav219533  [mRNA]  locus=scaffold30:667757:678045:- [translate_table: standard]